MGVFLKRYADSFLLIFKNPILFLPYIYSIIFMVAITLFAFFYSGAFSFFYSLDMSQLEAQQLQLYSFFYQNFLKVIISLAVFLFFAFAVGVSTNAWKYTLMANLVRGKAQKIFSSCRESLRYFWTVVFLNILLFILFLVVGIVSASILSLSFAFENLFFNWFLILVVIALFLIFRIAILFRYPFIFIKNLGAQASLKQSSLLFWDHKGYVVKVFFGIFSIWVLTTITALFVNALSFALMPPSFMIAETVVRVFLFVVGSLWADIFLFKSL